MRSPKYRSIAAGIAKRLSAVTSVTLENVEHAPADLAKLFLGIADTLDAVPPLKAAWLSGARSANAAEANARPLAVAFVKWVRATFGKEAAILQDFGLNAPAAHPATVATKAKAQAKAEATRSARHTRGKRQKKAIQAPAPVAATIDATTPAGQPPPAKS
jgi:hypothetical protein